ncbi:hypothetical protein B0H34DRAFT_350172 [Crassisporium funariophilum]|nr:hypothetical protein B0H34DRAFT_350172 [Crassisporium funariophilum]
MLCPWPCAILASSLSKHLCQTFYCCPCSQVLGVIRNEVDAWCISLIHTTVAKSNLAVQVGSLVLYRPLSLWDTTNM